jgi:hypothetical protein
LHLCSGVVPIGAAERVSCGSAILIEPRHSIEPRHLPPEHRASASGINHGGHRSGSTPSQVFRPSWGLLTGAAFNPARAGPVTRPASSFSLYLRGSADKPFPTDPQPAARDEPAGYRSALGGPIGTIWIGYLLPDQHPVTPPARVFVVAVLQLVTWGCRDTSRSTGIHALGDAGPTAPAGELRSLRHCGREAYGGQQGETRAGEQ